MMYTILAFVLFLIFTALGAIHVYWLFGGTWALRKAIPTKDKDAAMMPIPRSATLVVAVVLLAFGQLYLLKSGVFTFSLPDWVTTFGYWGIPTLFILRAIGEFKYVGFFKKIKTTEFAIADSKVFSPLCLCIGIVGMILQFF